MQIFGKGVFMELLEQQKMILRNYKKRLEQLESHRNIWQEKADELDTEITEVKMIMEITQKAMEETEAKNSA